RTAISALFILSTDKRPDLVPAIGEGGLRAVPRRPVVAALAYLRRGVLLGDQAVLVIVRVTVALAVAQIGGPRVVRVAQVGRDLPGHTAPDVGAGLVDRFDHGV